MDGIVVESLVLLDNRKRFQRIFGLLDDSSTSPPASRRKTRTEAIRLRRRFSDAVFTALRAHDRRAGSRDDRQASPDGGGLAQEWLWPQPTLPDENRRARPLGQTSFMVGAASSNVSVA